MLMNFLLGILNSYVSCYIVSIVLKSGKIMSLVWIRYFELLGSWLFCVERFFSTLMVIRSMMDIIYSISSVSVVSLMIPKIVTISSIMCFRLFSQYSFSVNYSFT